MPPPLPVELWGDIFSFLTASDLQQVSRTCTILRQISLPMLFRSVTITIPPDDNQSFKHCARSDPPFITIHPNTKLDDYALLSGSSSRLEFISQSHIARAVRNCSIRGVICAIRGISSYTPLPTAIVKVIYQFKALKQLSLRGISCVDGCSGELMSFLGASNLHTLRLSRCAIHFSLSEHMRQQSACGPKIALGAVENLMIEECDLAPLCISVLARPASVTSLTLVARTVPFDLPPPVLLPNLRSLKVMAAASDSPNFINFLERCPNICELHFLPPFATTLHGMDLSLYERPLESGALNNLEILEGTWSLVSRFGLHPDGRARKSIKHLITRSEAGATGLLVEGARICSLIKCFALSGRVETWEMDMAVLDSHTVEYLCSLGNLNQLKIAITESSGTVYQSAKDIVHLFCNCPLRLSRDLEIFELSIIPDAFTYLNGLRNFMFALKSLPHTNNLPPHPVSFLIHCERLKVMTISTGRISALTWLYDCRSGKATWVGKDSRPKRSVRSSA